MPWTPIGSRRSMSSGHPSGPSKEEVVEYLKNCDRDQIFELFALASGWSQIGPAGDRDFCNTPSWDPNRGGHVQIRMLDFTTKKISAIKEIRRVTALGLKEAKDVVEKAHATENGIVIVSQRWMSPSDLEQMKESLKRATICFEVDYL